MNIHADGGKIDRRFCILGHVVREYVTSAVPVSSRVVARRMKESISSATIRNIMGELEDEGYINQPHTSAGRIPTQSGYRHYVNRIKDEFIFEAKEAERLAVEYDRKIRTIKEVIEKTSFLISRELRNAGIVMWPSIEDSYLKRIKLVKVSSESILAIFITMTNAVKNYIINTERILERAELEKTENYINVNYEHVSFSRIAEDLRHDFQNISTEEDPDVVSAIESALAIIDSIVEENIDNEIYLEGLDYFMNEPEFRDVSVTRSILRVFSDRKDLIALMRGDLSHQGIRVYIGKENNCDMLKECSFVTSGYTLHGRTVGRIGVIGPTRMDYDHALRTVSCLSELISSKLEDIG